MNENVTVDVVTDSHSFHNLYEHKNLVGKRSVSARLIWFHLRGQHKTEWNWRKKTVLTEIRLISLCVLEIVLNSNIWQHATRFNILQL